MLVSIAMHARRWILPIALVASGSPAAAQNPEVQADATVNVGYSQFTQSTFQADPMAEPADVADSTSHRAFTEIRPGISVQSGRPRLSWRLAYQFSGNFSLDGSPLYTNQADAALFALPSKYTSLTVSTLLTQGGTSFLLSQRPAETGQPEIRAPGNPNLISATLAESLSWDAGRQMVLQQGLTGTLSAPQDDLGAFNGSVSGSLTLDRVFQRFSSGLEVRSTVSRLRPLQSSLEPYTSITNTALVRLNRDFSWRWNGLVTAGIEQVFMETPSRPLAFLPTGSVTALYTHGAAAAALDVSHGAFTNIQVGTVSVTDRITARGIFTLDEQQQRTLSFSAGILHNEPIGESEAQVAAGTGNAIQGDAGFTTEITRYILGNARYTVAYQFGQDGLEPILSHIVLVGVIAHYGTSSKARRPLPIRGRRVDGTDGSALPLDARPLDSGSDSDGSSGGGGGDDKGDSRGSRP
jgi:hypothetical protein